MLRNIKFDLATRYQLGNLLYVVTPEGMIDPAEVPLGWGFLEIYSDGTVCEKITPTRFNRVGTVDWLIRIGQASAAREVRSLVTRDTGMTRVA